MAARKPEVKYDRILLLVTFLLLGLGLIMVFSSSFVVAAESRGDPYYFLKRQAMWVALGLMAMYFFSRFHYKYLRKLSLVVLLLNFIMLGLIFSSFGSDLGTEAKRWLAFGPVTIQPSEFSKLAFVIFTAAYMSSRRLNLRSFWTGSFVPLFFVAIAFFLIQFQPDLGTAMVVLFATALVIVFAGMPFYQMFGLGLASVPPIAYFTFKEDYRVQRIFTLVDPWADASGSGYQVIQSFYALGPGHIFGSGLGRSKQKLFYLPEPHNDFIFAVIGEELGFIGAVSVLLLYLVLIWRGFLIAQRAPDLFGSLLAGGVTFLIAIQVIINVGVVTGSIPVTGINLPLISAGGSSVFFTLIGLGILLNVSKYGRAAAPPGRSA